MDMMRLLLADVTGCGCFRCGATARRCRPRSGSGRSAPAGRGRAGRRHPRRCGRPGPGTGPAGSPARTRPPARSGPPRAAVTGRAGSRADRTRSIGANAQSGFTGTHRPGPPRHPAADVLQVPGLAPAAAPRPGPRLAARNRSHDRTGCGPGSAATCRSSGCRATAARGASRVITTALSGRRPMQPASISSASSAPARPVPSARGCSSGLPLRSSCASRYRSSATSPVPLSPASRDPGTRGRPGPQPAAHARRGLPA